MIKSDIVLVVDDSPDTLSMVNDALEQTGLDVLVALEGKQALAIVKRLRPDIILMDAMMPNMDGFETCRKLKSQPDFADIPVIFMTGLTDTQDIVKGLECGGVDYLTKPVDPDELVARINVHIANARLASSAHDALDSAGQYVFTANTEGKIQWATPQTHALLTKAGANERWKNTVLSYSLSSWLSHHPEPKQHLSVSCEEYPLEVHFIGQRQPREFLFKLVDAKKLAGEEVLQDNLDLTTRESQVLFWLAKGKTNRDIAQILEMSPKTVKKHLEQIYPKLSVENRTSAAAIAIQVLTIANAG